MNYRFLIASLLACLFILSVSADERAQLFQQLEAEGATIGKITIVRENIFNPELPEESGSFYELSNRLHIVTRESVIRSQLLFKEGDPVFAARFLETERILRARKYLYLAEIHPDKADNNIVNLTVRTRDLWTLSPEFGFQRSGNENYTTIGIEDDNFLGSGASITVARVESLERTSNQILYNNQNFLSSRVRVNLGLSDSSDGGSFNVAAEKPFFSFDTRHAIGGGVSYFDGERPLYENGDELANYKQRSNYASFYRGSSTGRVNNWVRRTSYGLSLEDSKFGFSDDPGSAAIKPDDRELYYPYVSMQWLEDRFVTTKNYRGIGRTEDVYLGTRFDLLLGYASSELGSDRDALIIGSGFSSSVGTPEETLLSSSFSLSTRYESGNFANSLLNASVVWTHRFSDKWRFLTELKLAHTERPDLNNLVVLGGETGLRGYPIRYRNGRGSGVFTIEQRYFSNWYPLRLFRAGAAAFIDTGTVWGRNAFGNKNRELLSDVGIGLRFASTRGGSRKVIHIDLAFPLDGGNDIDSVQILVDAKDRF